LELACACGSTAGATLAALPALSLAALAAAARYEAGMPVETASRVNTNDSGI